MQLARHVPKDNEQYFLRTVTWRSIGKLHGQLCYTHQNQERTWGKNNSVLKIAEKHDLCFKQSKYNFNVEEIPILGVVVEQGEVEMKNDKVKAVKK